MTNEEREMLKEKTNGVLKELEPVAKSEHIAEARRLAEECELCDVVQYLGSNVDEVAEYLADLPEGATDDEKMEAIKAGLKKRAESLVPDYAMEPPFLGNEIEEARSKQEDANTRYKTQYHKVPWVTPVYRGRSAVDNPYFTNPSKALNKNRGNPIKRTSSTRFSSY